MEALIIDYNKTAEAAKKIDIEALKQARDEEYTGIKKQYKVHEDLPLSHEAFAWFIVNKCKLVDEMERLSRLVIKPMFSSSLLSQVPQEIWDIIILKSLQSINDTRLSNLLTPPQRADYNRLVEQFFICERKTWKKEQPSEEINSATQSQTKIQYQC